MFKLPLFSPCRTLRALAAVTAALLFGVSTLNADERVINPRIVGGVNIPIELVPSTVALLNTTRYNASQTPLNAQFCGGTLIQKKWVLTAAHCVTGDENGTMTMTAPADILVLAGVTNLAISPPPIAPISVVSVTVHPEWLSSNIVLGNDIALLELSADANAPIAQLDTQAIKFNDPALVAGWGALNTPVEGQSQTFPTSLQGVGVFMVPYDQCDAQYPLQQQLSGISVQPNQLCSGVNGGGKNPCHGDSGGALYRVDASLLPDSVVPVSVVGIVSFGAGCALAGYPEIYTNVQAYAGFINDTINASTVPSTVPTGPSGPTTPTTPTGPTGPTTPIDDSSTPTDPESVISPLASQDTESGSGCAIGGSSANDPFFPLLLLVSLYFLARRSRAL